MDENNCDLNTDCDDDRACVLNENRCVNPSNELIQFEIDGKYYYAESFDDITEAMQQLATLKKSEMKDLKCTLGQDYMESFDEFANKSVDEVKKILASFENPDDLITIINSANGTVYCEGLNYFKKVTESKLDDRNFAGIIFNITEGKEVIAQRHASVLQGTQRAVYFSNFSLLQDTHFICDYQLVKNLKPIVYYLVKITNMRWRDTNQIAMGAYHTGHDGQPFYILVPVAEHLFFCNRFKGRCEKMEWDGISEKPPRWKHGISLKKCKQKGCDLDQTLSYNLLDYIKNDNIKGVKKIYRDGFPVETTFNLHIACANNSVSMVKLLLKYGCSADYYNSAGNKPLHETLSPEIAELLLKENGVNINDQTQFGGETGLNIAIRERNIDMVKFFLHNGANTEIRTVYGKRPLDTAIEYSSHGKFVDFNYLNVIKLLVDKGSDIFDKDKGGSNILFSISDDSSIDIVKFLVEKGVSINDVNYDGDSYLHIAVQKGLLNISNYLIKQGANINQQNIRGETPLFRAVNYNKFHMIQLLIKNGADINIRDSEGRNVIFHLIYDGINIVKYLVKKKIDIDIVDTRGNTILHDTAYKGFSEIFKYLLKKGININIKNLEGFTPLYYLADGGFKNLIKSIDKKDIDFNSKNNTGETILFSIFKKTPHDMEIVQLLIEKGFDIREVDIHGNNLLFYCMKDETQISNLKYLIEKGLNVNHTNYRGETPLHLASSYGNAQAVRYLIENGSKVDVKNLYGDTPLLLATVNIRPEIIDILLSNNADFTIKNNQSTTFGNEIDSSIRLLENYELYAEIPAGDYLGHLSEEYQQKALDRYIHIRKCLKETGYEF